MKNKSIVSQLLFEQECKKNNEFNKLKFNEHLQCSPIGVWIFNDFSIVNQLGVKNKNPTYIWDYICMIENATEQSSSSVNIHVQ
ncbi:hypothetical protein DERF_014857 [Dermatophagoides farinae]|uniref:Uncharacterized protein n=1 Tax=Dermatophagoides farinae TaxID=6954 RepID=A0A922HPV7_DERFA|nr:hypothetical protein DERF_014857 [Dermatophagoides farinae]